MTAEELRTALRDFDSEAYEEVAQEGQSLPPTLIFTAEQETRIREIIREEVAAIEQEKFDRAMAEPYRPIRPKIFTSEDMDRLVEDYAEVRLGAADRTEPPIRPGPDEAGGPHG